MNEPPILPQSQWKIPNRFPKASLAPRELLIGAAVIFFAIVIFSAVAVLSPQEADPMASAKGGAMAYLKENLRDPGSLEYLVVNTAPQTEPGKNGYVTYIKYRAKNGFGGYNVEEKYFVADRDGRVLNVLDYP